MAAKPIKHNCLMESLRGLYGITPDTPDTGCLVDAVHAALTGGVKLVQYRDKISPPPIHVKRAEKLLGLCHQFKAKLIINDHLQLAIDIGADGLHLGTEDGDLLAARQRLGPEKILGASCYASLEQAKKAVAAGANYVAFGAVFASPTKPHAATAPLSLFKAAKTCVTVPSCAIGGITLDNAPSVIAAGAQMIAVISDLFHSPNGQPADPSDIEARAAAYQNLFTNHRLP